MVIITPWGDTILYLPRGLKVYFSFQILLGISYPTLIPHFTRCGSFIDWVTVFVEADALVWEVGFSCCPEVRVLEALTSDSVRPSRLVSTVVS